MSAIEIIGTLILLALVWLTGDTILVRRYRSRLARRYESRIDFRECPWCGKKLSTGLSMLAHIDNTHNGGSEK